MARIKDVLQIERNRTDKAEWNKIHLFKMGDFWRAYEWSAWLVAVITYNDKVRMATKDRRPLKLTRKTLANSDDTFCFVGFPIKSIGKFIPERTDFKSNDDKHLICYIDLPQPTDGTEVTYERLSEAATTWKNAIEISTKEDIVDEDGNVIEKQLIDMDLRNGEAVSRTVNSYLGIMSHSASYRVRQQLFNTDNFARIVEIDGDMLKSKPIAA